LKSDSFRSDVLSLFTVALFCLTILPRLLSYGMFFDGVTYASIARNMAEGYGSIWRPYYTDIIYPVFFDHPPLGFFLQSLAFRIVGDSLSVEAFWGFGAGLLVLLFIGMIWRVDCQTLEKPFAPADEGICRARRSSTGPGGWAPMAMFAVLPMTSWLFSNNLLEGTMTVFTTAAALLCIYGLNTPTRSKAVVATLCAGILVLGAALVKGPVGLFPLAVPAAWLVTMDRKHLSRAATVLALMSLGVIASFLLLSIFSSGFLPFVKRYLSQQVVASVSGSREKGGSRFGVLYVVLREVAVPLLVGAVIWVIARLKLRAGRPALSRRFWFYFSVALCGSLPIMLSPKQLMWYSFPSFPFYALAVAALFETPLARLEESLTLTKKRRTVAWALTSLVFIVAITWMISEKGLVRKESNFHKDFSLQPVAVPEREVISVYPAGLKRDWPLVANMQRQFKASLSDSVGHKYLLTTAENQTYFDSLKTYRKIHPPVPAKYLLYILRDSASDE
jgi:4-amino-4-deoxy-L-arabinose transferase-like glycosyltransferase